jgi:GH43 family beta-xylosidase
MVLNIFMLLIIAISVLLTNINVETKEEVVTYKNIPLITFRDSIMYEIDEVAVQKIIKSQEALNYKQRDELYDATIITRNTDNLSDIISAEFILKKEQIYKLYENVSLDTSNNTHLRSDYLVYDEKSFVIKNNTDFVLNYNESTLKGTNLYFDAKNNIINAKNTHFLLNNKDFIK